MSKQTSLQFFLMGLIDLEIGKGIPTDKEIQLHNLYAQAKAMEREQIINAYATAVSKENNTDYIGMHEETSGEIYYNETYSGGEQ
jgi:hypothetical protein